MKILKTFLKQEKSSSEVHKVATKSGKMDSERLPTQEMSTNLMKTSKKEQGLRSATETVNLYI